MTKTFTTTYELRHYKGGESLLCLVCHSEGVARFWLGLLEPEDRKHYRIVKVVTDSDGHVGFQETLDTGQYEENQE